MNDLENETASIAWTQKGSFNSCCTALPALKKQHKKRAAARSSRTPELFPLPVSSESLLTPPSLWNHARALRRCVLRSCQIAHPAPKCNEKRAAARSFCLPELLPLLVCIQIPAHVALVAKACPARSDGAHFAPAALPRPEMQHKKRAAACSFPAPSLFLRSVSVRIPAHSALNAESLPAQTAHAWMRNVDGEQESRPRVRTACTSPLSNCPPCTKMQRKKAAVRAFCPPELLP